jgi:hypothetical protein
MNNLIELDLAGVTTKYMTPAAYSITFTQSGAQVGIPSALTTSALALDANTAAWVFAAVRKLDTLGRLKRNWDSHDGLPLTPGAKKITFDALGWLRNQDLPVPGIFLRSGGTVQIEWNLDGKTLELGLGERGISEYLKVDQQGIVDEVEDVEYANDEARAKLQTLADWLKNA